MNAPWPVLLLSLSCFASLSELRSQPAPSPATSQTAADPPANIRAETTKLLQADADKIAQEAKAHPGAPAAPAAGITVMDPYIVRNKPLPDIVIPKYKTPLKRFLDTGYITKNLSIGGENGTPSYGHGTPRPGRLEIKFNIPF